MKSTLYLFHFISFPRCKWLWAYSHFYKNSFDHLCLHFASTILKKKNFFKENNLSNYFAITINFRANICIWMILNLLDVSIIGLSNFYFYLMALITDYNRMLRRKKKTLKKIAEWFSLNSFISCISTRSKNNSAWMKIFISVVLY